MIILIAIGYLKNDEPMDERLDQINAIKAEMKQFATNNDNLAEQRKGIVYKILVCETAIKGYLQAIRMIDQNRTSNTEQYHRLNEQLQKLLTDELQ